MPRTPAVFLLLAACATSSGQSAARSPAMPAIAIDIEKNPDLRFRIDNFVVPDGSRREFEEAMHRNLAFIRTLPGFLGHLAFEKTGGPTTFNITTIAVWESQAAIDRASEQVRAYYRRIGFDPPPMMAQWGVRGELGYFHAPRSLQ